MFTVKTILDFINQIAPFNLAFDWDNCGLQVGSEKNNVKKISFALDANSYTIKDAINERSDLLITHHPLIFKSIKKIDTNSKIGNLIDLSLKNNLNIIAAHTNYDIYANGVAKSIANILNLKNLKPLEPATRNFYKLVIFIPQENEEHLKTNLFKASLGTIGNDYVNCSFSGLGNSTFKAVNNAKPFIGEKNKLKKLDEKRLELIINEKDILKATDIIYKYHPYEEPTFEFYPVKTFSKNTGLGLVGETEIENNFLKFCQEKLNLNILKIAGNSKQKIKKVALVPGSGGNYIDLAKIMGADLFITGDVSYHQAELAEDLDIMVLDAGHFETECFSVKHLIEIFKTELTEDDLIFHYIEQKSPWLYLNTK